MTIACWFPLIHAKIKSEKYYNISFPEEERWKVKAIYIETDSFMIVIYRHIPIL